VIEVLSFVGVIAVLIFVHEMGHFLAAKAFGVKVLEFALGFPPRIASFHLGGTRYSLNAIPLGGFVKLLGEEDPTHPGSLASKGILTRILVLSAGALMNVALPLVIFVIILLIPQETIEGNVQIRGVAVGSPADAAGIRTGDIVVSVNGQEINNTAELAYRIHLNLGELTIWEIYRGKPRATGFVGGGGDPGLMPELGPVEASVSTVTLIPRWSPPSGEGNAGVLIETVSPQLVSRSFPIWDAIPGSMQRMGEMLILFRNEIVGWTLRDSNPQLTGPIGIAQISGEVARIGWRPLLELTALLSMNLAILNILPIPALDGGRLIFVGLEWVRRGKRVRPEREALVHAVGVVFLISFIAVISYFDIVRIVRGESILN